MLCCGGARGGVRGGCARVAALMLLHVNLMLMLFSGAGLVMAARLKWDPSAYVLLREAAPLEYRVACVLLPAAALALLVLAHAAVGAVAAGAHCTARRPILFTYATVMSLLTLAEVSALAWATWRALAWLNSEHARELMELLEARDHLRAALQILAKWFPLPEKISELINEVEADLPRNGFAAAGAFITLLILQPTAVVLALMATRLPAPASPPPRASLSTLASTASAGTVSRAASQRTRQKYHSEASTVSEKAPLRTAYKNGKLVIINQP